MHILCALQFFITACTFIILQIPNVGKKHEETSKRDATVNKLISMLSQDAQDDVMNCRKKHGYRYSNKWLYECVIMKIKSFRLYRHIRNRGILPLPHPSTIHKRIRCLRASFGFDQNLLKVLKEKAAGMPPYQRRGTYVLTFYSCTL